MPIGIQIRILIEMSCNHCVMHVKKELESLNGITVENVEIGKAVVSGENINNDDLVNAIDEAGYEVKEIKDL
ncbi:heavy metal binding protein [Deferribacter desulfuricans SSM1]|uniref:Heavy metal binding protein n=1 Tax=Deferribacter desulfuricans (strain DSM 14783 / JCM 11476 / NBRC 101012 / SSM1) TaxID=639282 RepID=D3P992_DEFDS|nr:heavy-metal-associated domain-containing protein [Deferribacter desulfuricans]BAI81282.1 heavy metal binding protein [Deferribacter desulfuricans SSM1]